MSLPLTARSVCAVGLTMLLLGFAGCFASKYTLIAPDKAKVDRAYVGDWDGVTKDGDHATLLIRNIDDRMYYVETRDEGKADKPDRYVGFIAAIKGATFAHLRPLQEDGSVPEEWLIMRLELAGGERLTIRQLDEDFMKDKPVGSSEQLRKVLEDNLGSEAMYDKDEQITATRGVTAAQ